MILNGHLEVRVALRVHSTSGKAIPFDSIEDGYVHEKWAVLSDSSGDSLYVSGSLNESKTALTINAENIEVHCSWHGEQDQQRVEQARVDFERLWKNEHPGKKVLHLPEAVRQRLITFAQLDLISSRAFPKEIDGSSAIPPRNSAAASERAAGLCSDKGRPKAAGGPLCWHGDRTGHPLATSSGGCKAPD